MHDRTEITPRIVVVKPGVGGAAMHTDGVMLHAPSPTTCVVDTTGAGDAFDAGLIDAVLDGADARQTLLRAATCGALSTRRPGALNGLAIREELEAIHR